MRYQKHNSAKRTFEKIAKNKECYYVIHYSCEAFIKDDGTSPRITSIAVRSLKSGQTNSFSIHKIAETKRISFDQIASKYNELELEMLKRFFAFLKENSKINWVHWHMNDLNFGFQALEHRFEVLGGKPYKLDNENKIDLPRLLCDYYGSGYINNPGLKNLAELNKISLKDWLDGQKEPEAFSKKEYVKMHQSTLRKVNIIASIFERQIDGSLKTLSRWRNIYGFSFQGIFKYWKDHWWCCLISWAATLLIGGFIGWLIG